MGFFKSEPPPPPPVSHVGPKTTLRGDLSSASVVEVDGAVEGAVTTKAGLSIAPGGRVEGKVSAGRLECSGLLRGEAEVPGVALFESTADFEGELRASTLAVRKGARIQGRLARRSPPA